MNKHILYEHPNVWRCLKHATLTFVAKENYQEKGMQRCVVGYGTITKHFGSVNPYKNDDLQQKKFMEDFVVFCC
jgi:hypothetical protein